MPLALFLAGSAQRHPLIQCHVITDHCRFPDNDAVAVVNEKAFPDLGPGMNLYPRLPGRPLRHPSGKEIMLLTIQLMRHTIMQDHLEAWV